MAAPLFKTDSGLLFHAGKILVLTVGLPARGKTHVSRALERYLRWLGVKTQVVSLGDYRRKRIGGKGKLPPDYFTLGEKSPETVKLRQEISQGCEQLIWKFFEGGGQVVIYDANNGTRKQRQAIAERFDKGGIHIVFLESVCDNKEIVEANIRSVKISSPDYKGWDPEKAVEDYYSRIRDHEKYYEPVTDTDWPFIRIFNVGDKIEVNNIHGYLQSRIIFFLMNIHNKYRTIYFARSGQSLIEHSYKADSDLSPAGWEYAERLRSFLIERRAKCLLERGLNPVGRRLVIWTSPRRRAAHTAWPFLTHAAAAGGTVSPYPFATPSQSVAASPIMRPLAAASVSVPSLSLGQSAADGSTSSNGSSPNLNNTSLPSPLSANLHLPQPKAVAALLHPHLHSHSHGGSERSSPKLPTHQQPNAPLRVKVIEKPQMSEINPGVWDGLSPEIAREQYPDEWERFLKDPYAFRAPRAESYHDLCVRLEPTIIELEREQEDLLIIGHASVIRCLLAYLIGLPASEIPAIEVARGDLLEVVPASYGVHSQAFHFWDGPGRRGSWGGAGEGGYYGLGAERGLVGSKARTRSMGAMVPMTLDSPGASPSPVPTNGGDTQSQFLSPSPTTTAISSTLHDWMTDGGRSGDLDGGGGGVFGEVAGKAMRVIDEVAVVTDDEGGSEDGNNFYENVVESTKGKRQFSVVSTGRPVV